MCSMKNAADLIIHMRDQRIILLAVDQCRVFSTRHGPQTLIAQQAVFAFFRHITIITIIMVIIVVLTTSSATIFVLIREPSKFYCQLREETSRD